MGCNGNVHLYEWLCPYRNGGSYGDERDATCEVAGAYTYTATVTFDEYKNGEEIKATRTESIPALGHNYELEWSWEGFVATATFTCKNDAAHKETPAVSIDNEVTTPATCEAAGVRTYTATVTFSEVEY